MTTNARRQAPPRRRDGPEGGPSRGSLLWAKPRNSFCMWGRYQMGSSALALRAPHAVLLLRHPPRAAPRALSGRSWSASYLTRGRGLKFFLGVIPDLLAESIVGFLSSTWPQAFSDCAPGLPDIGIQKEKIVLIYNLYPKRSTLDNFLNI